ncbi:glycoside hydrolase family 13 protein [Nesterenkonia xinjiangensis]|uniref:Alpha-glucosidase n=1 Tax=Nesterenkonia xinjiangensis TaxID=225327 RepID=A0A7Z0GP30_9MICC|nr:glycoside hydrolase family 13 protein [Nesterenkonia xinjiangensis]NYJ79562.1 alpha-glucosidase [Nesterenkonia xinjiangensis]
MPAPAHPSPPPADLLPHHDGSPLHVSDDAPALGERVRVRLRVPEGFGPLEAVMVRSNPDREPTWDEAEPLGAAGGWQWWEAEVTVHNPRHGYRWLLRGAGRVHWLNQSGLHPGEVRDADDFVLLATPAAPAWLAESVMYQIFPDRFARSAEAADREAPEWAIPAAWEDPVAPVMPCRSQQLYGGDLDGIVEKLDHLAELGVDLIYLTPIFPAASNHRYDAASFERVDPLLGGDEAYVRLVRAAHARGMRVIGDLTSNHSGDRHEWFQTALADPGAPERQYYYFAEDGSYESWLGTPSLPKFDWSSEQLRERFIQGTDSVVARWLLPPFEADGWRIDVANMTGRLRDVDLNAEVRQILRRTMEKVNPDTVLLAESTNDATEDLQGDAWHGAMTYPAFTRPLWSWLSDPTGEPWTTAEGSQRTEPWFFGLPLGGIPKITAAEFAQAVTRFSAGIPWRIRLGNMQPLNTHDTARFSTHAAEGAMPLALGLAMTLPGVPVLFAGDEFGLTGADGELSRTPMPWGTESQPEVAERLRLCRELVGLRRGHEVLARGGMRWVHADDDAVVFLRESSQESLLVLATMAEREVELPVVAVPGLAASGGQRDEPAVSRLTGESVCGLSGETMRISALGPSFTVWRLPGVPAPR